MDSINNSKILFILLWTIVLFYFTMHPYTLKFYFENALGKGILLFLIIIITYVAPYLGIIASVVLIYLYNSKVFTIEGMTSTNSSKKQKQKQKEEESESAEKKALPTSEDSLKNNKITVEKNLRPKESKTLPVAKMSKDIKTTKEPSPHNS